VIGWPEGKSSTGMRGQSSRLCKTGELSGLKKVGYWIYAVAMIEVRMREGNFRSLNLSSTSCKQW